MATYDMVSVAAAIQARKSQSDVTASEMRAYAEQAGLIKTAQAVEGVEARLAAVRSELYKMNVEKLKLKLDYFEGRDKLALQFQKLSLQDLWNQRNALAKQISDHERRAAKLQDSAGDEDKEALRRLKGKYQEFAKTRPSLHAKMKAIVDLDPSTDSKDLLNPGIRKGHAATMRRWMDEINFEATGDKKIFEIDESTGTILNLDKLQDSGDEANPLRQFLQPSQIDEIFEIRGSSLFDQYNEHKIADAEAQKSTQAALAELRNSAATLTAAKSPEDLAEVQKSLRDTLITHDEVFTKGSGIDTANLNQLKDELELYKSAQRSEKRLEALADKLVAEKPSAAVQLRNQMAHRMASPYIRAWARDNGFDELGHVTVEDGKYDPASYIPGRDDMAVVRAFNRQAERGAGRYGFKSIGSGDIVQVEVDGEPVVGERLKIHAGDPVGTVRVMTETGDVLTLAPDEINQVVVIERRPDRVSPIVNRAKGRAYLMRDQIRAARERAGVDVPGSEDNMKITEGGNAVVDADTNRNIDELEYNQKVEEFLTTDQIQGKVHLGRQFLVKQLDGTVFEVIPGEGLRPVKEPDLLDLVKAAPARRVVGEFEAEAGADPTVRMLGRVDTDRPNLELVFEPLPGEDNFSEETKQYFDAAEQSKKSGVTLSDLGYKASDKRFSPLAGQTYKNEYVVGGVKYVDLDQAPPRPPSRSEGLKVPGKPAKQPTGFKNQFEADKAAIEAAAAQMGKRPETPETVTGQPTEPERVDKGVLFDEDAVRQEQKDEDTRRIWNDAAQKARKRGEPLPEIPIGWEVVEGELQKIADRLPPTRVTPQAEIPPPQPDSTTVLPSQSVTPPIDSLRASVPGMSAAGDRGAADRAKLAAMEADEPPPPPPPATGTDLEAVAETPQPAPTTVPEPPPEPDSPPVDNAALLKRIQDMQSRVDALGKGRKQKKRKDKDKVKLDESSQAVIDAAGLSSEDIQKRKDNADKLMIELLVAYSTEDDPRSDAMGDRYAKLVEAGKLLGITSDEMGDLVVDELMRVQDDEGNPVPHEFKDGKLVPIKAKSPTAAPAPAAAPPAPPAPPPAAAPPAAFEDPVGDRLKEVEAEDAEAAAGAGAKAIQDNTAKALAAVSTLTALSSEKQDQVNEEANKVSSGFAPGRTTADTVAKIDQMTDRMKQLRQSQQRFNSMPTLPTGTTV